MPRTSIKDWLWSQHLPGTLRDDFEKLFALPENWRADARILHDNDTFLVADAFAHDLEAILEGKD